MVARVGPEEVAPTESMFLPRAGEAAVQVWCVGMSLKPPPFPTAKIRRFCGFCNGSAERESI